MPRSPPLSQHDLSSDLSSLDETMSSLHTRPVSTASLGSESSLHEMITHLQQELSRKTAQLDAQRADGYSTILEKEALLEEVRAELGAKRREEKELRGKEKIYVSQIGTLEVQTDKYKDERDKMKSAYQNARKQYEEQCSE
jgi:septal ring factor EnvC (AmiA/AmiB activator)